MDKLTNQELRQVLVFSILMQKDEGILGKAPSYIREKFSTCLSDSTPERNLDSEGLAKFNLYVSRWGVKI